MGIKLFNQQIIKRTFIVLSIALLLMILLAPNSFAATSSGAVGVEGRVPSEPPKNAPTITFPANNSNITDLPVTVTGLCQTGLLIKVFKNNVFAGSAMCVRGSYSISIDLFVGRNELIARAYDELDQASPDSNMVVVNFPVSPFVGTNRVSLSSAFAKRGAVPGSTLSWPIILSGGSGPYAITIDWGDGTQTDIISREFPGTFDISHIYKSAGIYNILIRVTDKNGEKAFLQLIGVGNGEIGDNQATANQATVREVVRIVWWPVLLIIPFMLIAFWLGRRYELLSLRRRFDR